MISLANKILGATSKKTHLFFVGQAGFVVKNKNGALFAIDLYLSDCVERIEGNIGFKRMQPKILDATDLEFDVLVTTHPHVDHFDIDSVPILMSNNRTKLFASVDCEKDVKRLQMHSDRISFVTPGDCYGDDNFDISFINCDHGTGAPDAFGVILTVDSVRICFVGDSCLRLDRVDEYLSQGAIDVLIAPVNGAYGNLDEQECAQLSNAINPKLTIPCHFGMFAAHGGNPNEFIRIMNHDYPKQKYLLMTPGEGIVLIQEEK